MLYISISYFVISKNLFFSTERQKGSGYQWVGRQGGTGKTRGSRNGIRYMRKESAFNKGEKECTNKNLKVKGLP